jgi:hypothetical protein
MSSENRDHLVGTEKPSPRNTWQRPTVRRLAANQAEGGNHPCNDGSGGGGCDNPTPHS